MRGRLRLGNERLKVRLEKLAQTPADLQATMTDLEGSTRKILRVLDREPGDDANAEADLRGGAGDRCATAHCRVT